MMVFDMTTKQYRAATAAEVAAAQVVIDRSNAVSTALAALAKSNAIRFESLRLLPFEEQAAALKL